MAKPDKDTKAKGKAAAKDEDEAPKGKKPLSEKARKARIDELLAELRDSDDPIEKRGIRAKLRGLGHTGGLGGKGKKKAKDEDDEDEKPSKKKASKKAPVEDDEEDEEEDVVEDDDEDEDDE